MHVVVDLASGCVLFVASVVEFGPPFRVDGVAVAGVDARSVDVREVDVVPPDCVPGSVWGEGGCRLPAEALAALQHAADTRLAAAAAAEITGGISRGALFYPTDQTSQINLAGVVTLTLLPNLPADWAQPLTCRDTAGVWARRPHTAAQVQEIGQAVAAHVDACRARLAERRAALAAAQTTAQVQAVVW